MNKEKLFLFLIRPVRGISDEYLQDIEDAVVKLREKYDVYDPITDTNQNDDTGYRICMDNLNAMNEADLIGVIWDGKSQGCLFDLGMAFALEKPTIPVFGLFSEPATEGKSFVKMVRHWAYHYKELLAPEEK